MKIKKHTTKPAPEPEEQSVQEQMTHLFSELASINERILGFTDELDKELQRRLAPRLDEAGDMFYRMRCEIAQELIQFFQHAPLWELHVVDKSANSLGVTHVRKLYADGWRYIRTAYENGRTLEIYHRPCMPADPNQFEKLYTSFFKRLRKDCNLKDAVTKPREPDSTEVLPGTDAPFVPPTFTQPKPAAEDNEAEKQEELPLDQSPTKPAVKSRLVIKRKK